MHSMDLILTLTGGLAGALVFGLVTQRMGLSPIVGYLLSGIAVGPYSPGFTANHELAEQLAEIGVILLMFGVGLHFHLDELLAVRRIALPGAVAQSFVATLLGAIVARVFGWDWTAAVVFGLSLSVASTVVLLRVLADNNDLHTRTGHVAVGWLVVEDLFTVLVLVLLPAVLGTGQVEWGRLPLTLGLTAVKIAILLALVFLVGGRAIPWLLDRVAATRSRELFTLTVLVVALGIAVGSAKLFGVSMALGAFLAGMIVGRSEFSLRAATEALPMRDAFAVLFFVSVGMLLDPWQLWDSPGLIAATLAVILLGKSLAALVIVLVMGYPPRLALAVAVALSQIGEFSFILASLGVQLGVLTARAYNTLVAAAIISITLNPLLYRTIGPVAQWLDRRPRFGKWLIRGRRAEPSPESAAPVVPADSHRAVIVGYGPVGRTVSRLLRANGIEPTVIELNLETVRRLRAEGLPAVYGDAGRHETLQEAGVTQAGSLILSHAGMQDVQEVIRLARTLNPRIRILARTAYVGELRTLRDAGAEFVFAGEGEVALALTEAILRQLGATAEQVDRERERVRHDLLGRPTDPQPSAGAAAPQPSEPALGETPRPHPALSPADGGEESDIAS